MMISIAIKESKHEVVIFLEFLIQLSLETLFCFTLRQRELDNNQTTVRETSMFGFLQLPVSGDYRRSKALWKRVNIFGRPRGHGSLIKILKHAFWPTFLPRR